MSQLTHPNYRSDIDGLRALAVLSVVCFHTFPSWLPGGFVGVDIFFVISGFLISSIIFNNLERNSFEFIDFYIRRIVRIFPALILILTACFILGWFVLLADEYKQLGKHIAAGAGFVSNFALWRESGYFDNTAETKPLLHLWSLGIEEQFYIVWPLALWVAHKRKINPLLLTGLIAVISFSINIHVVQADRVNAFYSPLTRFWELLIGSLLAYVSIHPLTSPHANFRKIIFGIQLFDIRSLTGAALIFTSIFNFTKDTVFPGGWALLPSIGCALILSAGPNAWLNKTFLSNKALVWFGLISFPLYLWHWPLISFARIIENETPSIQIRAGAIIISVFLAWLTYQFIEKPFRFGPNKNRKAMGLMGLMVIVGYIGYNDYSRNGLAFRVRDFEKIVKAAGEWQYPGNLKLFTFQGNKFFGQNSQTSRTTLFIGDSNIEQYYVRIDELISTKPKSTNNVIFATEGGCTPIPHVVRNGGRDCLAYLNNTLDLALSRVDVSTVVIGAQWFTCLSPGNCYYDDQGVKLQIEKQNAAYFKALNSLTTYINKLKNGNKEVYLILNIPIGKKNDPRYMAQRSFETFPIILKMREGGISVQEIIEEYGFILKDLSVVAGNSGARVIDPMANLCKRNFCSSVDEFREPIYKDRSHLRPSFVRNNANFIDGTVSN